MALKPCVLKLFCKVSVYQGFRTVQLRVPHVRYPKLNSPESMVFHFFQKHWGFKGFSKVFGGVRQRPKRSVPDQPFDPAHSFFVGFGTFSAVRRPFQKHCVFKGISKVFGVCGRNQGISRYWRLPRVSDCSASGTSYVRRKGIS